MAAEPVENAGAGAAGIDECRRAAPARYLCRVDTQRGPAPIDMGVEVDQPGYDEQPADIDGLGTAGGDVAPISVTVPSPKAMSAVSSRPLAGSMMRPPLRTRSGICAPQIKPGGADVHRAYQNHWSQ
jgi:hypothetical protein